MSKPTTEVHERIIGELHLRARISTAAANVWFFKTSMSSLKHRFAETGTVKGTRPKRPKSNIS